MYEAFTAKLITSVGDIGEFERMADGRKLRIYQSEQPGHVTVVITDPDDPDTPDDAEAPVDLVNAYYNR